MLKQALGSTLLLTATHAMALTLGATQGSVIIGRPIDILVSSSLDAADAASGLCLEAEVVYGETRVPASAVTTAIHRLGLDGTGALRVRVSTPVNEPIVTVALKAGCQNSFRRSYTLLADFESNPTPSAVAVSRDVTAPKSVGRVGSETSATSEASGKRASSANGSASTRGASGGSASEASVQQSAVATEPVPALVAETPVHLSTPARRPEGVVRLNSKSRPAPRASTGQVSEAGAKQSVTAPGGAKLKLDPIELSAAAGSVQATAKAPEPPKTAPATAADTVDAAPAPTSDAATMPTLAVPETAVQQELKALREEQSRLRMAVESVNAELARAQQDRFSNPVVYGLGAAVVLLLGGVVYLLRRNRGARVDTQAWWNSSQPATTSQPDLSSAAGIGAEQGASLPDSDMAGLEAVEAGASVFQEVPVAEVGIDALLDLWQQVDFLLSIGQPFDALKALESFVQQFPRASEAPYLRWLQLALQQGDERSLSQAQAAYEHHFHRLLPASATASTRNGLDSDRGFLLRLTTAWPGAQAQALIDAALKSQPGDPAGGLQERNVRVFDDLFALRRLLKTLPALPEDLSSVLPPTRASAEPATIAAPLANEEEAAQWMSVGEVAGEPPIERAEPPAPMLDLDLTPDVADTKPQAETVKPELPPLDFDFFAFDPAASKQETLENKDGAKPAA